MPIMLSIAQKNFGHAVLRRLNYILKDDLLDYCTSPTFYILPDINLIQFYNELLSVD